MFNESSLDDWVAVPRAQVRGERLATFHDRGVLIWRDNGADVLLVAHLDHCGEGYSEQAAKLVRSKANKHVVRSVALDDRLGCWGITELVRRGVHADVLFTDCEEMGDSTAGDFLATRPYKLVLSLDRAGVDCVLYKYQHAKRWARMCARSIGPVEYGSYSCVQSLDIGCCGVNMGVGYYEHNGPHCWADLRLTEVQLQRAQTFIREARGRLWGWNDSMEPRRAPASGFVSRFEQWQRGHNDDRLDDSLDWPGSLSEQTKLELIEGADYTLDSYEQINREIARSNGKRR